MEKFNDENGVFDWKEFRKVLWTIVRYAVTAVVGYFFGSCI